MIRAEHPDPQEGFVHADGLSDEALDLARSRGWQITALDQAPDLDLPQNADRLWRGARATGLPWRLEQRVDQVDAHRVTVLYVYELDRPERWEEWSWVGEALNPAHRPRIPLYRAKALLSAAV